MEGDYERETERFVKEVATKYLIDQLLLSHP